MRILVTGSEGFIGKNLVIRLGELSNYEVIPFGRRESMEVLKKKVELADAVIHLAGVNRPTNSNEFLTSNSELTADLCDLIIKSGKKIPLILASSIQAELDNPYGKSKLEAELAAEKLAISAESPVTIYRLPNVFGKWCKPNYNSVVATFCDNVANDRPLKINDLNTVLKLVYVDDVVNTFIASLNSVTKGLSYGSVTPEYSITLGLLAAQIESFPKCRDELIVEPVGSGLVRALYATYVSYLPPSKFSYSLPMHGDERGLFVEMLKTQDSGQFSFFTAYPGVTRGGHYHHTKTEKFLVIKGKARFGFRNIITGEKYEIFTSGDYSQIVETVPGWTHDITNIGETEMIVMLWANEIFDRARPDTISAKV